MHSQQPKELMKQRSAALLKEKTCTVSIGRFK